MIEEEKAYFAGGCFWGVEHYFQNLGGVIETKVGYMGGTTKNPTYEEVCNKDTCHTETLEVTYDPTRVEFEDLAKLFFEIHDPTQVNRQGPDIGPQYRSVIFFTNKDQKSIAEKLIKTLEDKSLKIATKLEKATTFWEAEDYHQQYYAKNGNSPYCHTREERF